jgi:hypothetical protein
MLFEELLQPSTRLMKFLVSRLSIQVLLASLFFDQTGLLSTMAEHFEWSNDTSITGQYEYATAFSQNHYDAEQEDTVATLGEVYSTSKIRQQDEAIATMLKDCTRAGLLQLTHSFAEAEHAGHNQCLAIIAEIPEEERAWRFEAVSQYITTHTTLPC